VELLVHYPSAVVVRLAELVVQEVLAAALPV
jgi:hypothetical protein